MGERGVNEGLVVDVFVRLGALHEPVGDEQTAEGLGLDHLHGLELGLALVEHLVNLRRRGDGERVRKKRWSSAGDGEAADGTHPVGDSEAILEDLVVPVALVEDVGADAARVSHGTCKYVCARLQMCQDGPDGGTSSASHRGTTFRIRWKLYLVTYGQSQSGCIFHKCTHRQICRMNTSVMANAPRLENMPRLFGSQKRNFPNRGVTLA